MKKNSISIVIVSFNTRTLIEQCLRSVLNNINKTLDEIVVVDNCSTDETQGMLRKEFPDIPLVVTEMNRGFSHACNIGLKRSTSEYVLFINGDVELPPRTLETMRHKMSMEPRVGILSPELISEGGRLSQMSWGWNLSLFGEMRQKVFSPKHIVRYPFIRNWVRSIQKKERDVPIVAGACMLARRDVMNSIQGLDESFELYFEDADLCLRCWKAGYKVLFTPGIKVFHRLGQSGKSSPRKIWLVYRQSQIHFYRKHNSLPELLFLKLYLWIKFITSRIYWTDPVFRYWISQIISEKKRLHLSDSKTKKEMVN